jgi:hypothetical protein
MTSIKLITYDFIFVMLAQRAEVSMVTVTSTQNYKVAIIAFSNMSQFIHERDTGWNSAADRGYARLRIRMFLPVS